MSGMNPELIKAAREKKYQEAEGFLDNAPAFDLKFPADVSETLEDVAKKLSVAAGVSFEVAWCTIVEDAAVHGVEMLRRQRNN